MKTLQTIIPAVFNQIRQGSTFLSIKNYIDNYGGQSNFGIVFHANYINAVKNAINTWIVYKPKDDIEHRTRIDLINSYRDTLKGHNPRALSAHAYSPITDGKQLIKSVKWHDAGKTVHFWGFLVHKVEIIPAVYPYDSRGASTLARSRLIHMTQLGRFRQFAIQDGRFGSIGVDNLTLTQKDLLRSVSNYNGSV
jgi:hypothetical protein